MAYSYSEHTGSGTLGPFSFSSIQLLEETVEPWSSQLDVYRNGVLLTYTTDYTINSVGKTVTLAGSQPVLLATETLRIARSTRVSSRYVDYVDSTNITSELLDLDSNQNFFLAQEAMDLQLDSMVRGTDGQWNGRGYRVQNIGSAVNGTDAVTLNQLQAAVTGALPASLSGFGVSTATGDGSTVNYTLPAAISTITSPTDVEVYINGIRQRPTTDYTISSGNIVISPAPSSGDNILFSWPEGPISGLITADSVSTTSIQNQAVTPAKIQPGSSGQFLKTVSGAVWAAITSADITNFNAGVQSNRLDQMTAPTASVGMNSNKITSLASGVSGTDAANIDNITNYKWCASYLQAHDGTGSSTSRTYVVTGVPFTIGAATISVPLTDGGTSFSLNITVPAIKTGNLDSSAFGPVHVYSISPGGAGHGWRLTWNCVTNTSIELIVVRTFGVSTISGGTAAITLFRRD